MGQTAYYLRRSLLVRLVYVLLQERWLAVRQTSQERHSATATTRVAGGRESLPVHKGMGRVKSQGPKGRVSPTPLEFWSNFRKFAAGPSFEVASGQHKQGAGLARMGIVRFRLAHTRIARIRKGGSVSQRG